MWKLTLNPIQPISCDNNSNTQSHRVNRPLHEKSVKVTLAPIYKTTVIPNGNVLQSTDISAHKLRPLRMHIAEGFRPALVEHTMIRVRAVNKRLLTTTNAVFTV